MQVPATASRWYWCLILLATAGIFFVFGWTTHAPVEADENQQPLFYRDRAGYEFARPLIDNESLYSTRERAYNQLDLTLHDEAQKLKADGVVEDIAIYFRDLTTWHWVGVGEQKKFAPASLFKLPVMMAYFKEAEQKPSILTEKIVLPSGLRGVSQNFEVPDLLKVGSSYTVKQLIKEMIVASDNRAMVALVQHLPSASLQRVFIDLGLSPQLLTDTTDSISPRLYAIFLRVLYNATYLSREYSEQALALLAQSSFKVGLVAGLPEGAKIAHKYGERSYGAADEAFGERELHDCGIVYSKAGDYAICVMTKGYELDKLAGAIADISRVAYQFSQRPTQEAGQ